MELSSVFSNTPFRATIASSLHCKNRVSSSSSSDGRRSIVVLPTNFYYMRHCRRIVPPSLFHLSIDDAASHPLPGMFSLGRKNTTSASVNTRHPKQRIPIIQACSTGIDKAGTNISEESVTANILKFSKAFLEFARPYTIQGHAIMSLSIVAANLPEKASTVLALPFLIKAFAGLITLLSTSVFVSGINQIYDIDIDKINKPYVPLVADDFSVTTAWLVLLFFTSLGFLLVGLTRDPLIIGPYILLLLVGAIYTIPPFRWKRFPVGAFFTMAALRFFGNHGAYYATRKALGLPFQWSYPITFMVTFSALFSLILSIVKDLPDVEGDQRYGIQTWPVKYGVRKMALVASALLLLNYIGAISAAIFLPQAFRSSIMIPAHTILALISVFQIWLLEKANYTQESLTTFYQFLWRLSDVEYNLFAFI